MIQEGCGAITKPIDSRTGRFNDDSFRVCKILGADVGSSHILKGYVINRAPEGNGKEIVKNAVVCCYRCPFLLNSGETKGTILVENAE